MRGALHPGLTPASPFSTLCFSTRLLIKMTKAITMTLPGPNGPLWTHVWLQSRTSSKLKQQPWNLRQGLETFLCVCVCISKAISAVQVVPGHTQTALSARTAFVCFTLLVTMAHKQLWKGRTDAVVSKIRLD